MIAAQSNKSDLFPVNSNNIPAALKDREHFVVWNHTYIADRDIWTKIPLQPNGLPAKVNNLTSLNRLEDVLSAYESNGYSGIGIVLRDGLCGIDLDHVIDQDGNVEGWAQEIVERFSGTYMERSPSKDGLHILAFGTPERNGKRGPDNRLEIYDESSPRYLTVTGQRYGQATDITDQKESIDWLFERFPKKIKEPTLKEPALRKMVEGFQESDQFIIDKACKNPAFFTLFSGVIAGYSSRSEAELAFCNNLACYTDDPIQIDRIYQASLLRRPKWDEPHGADGETYGFLTIEKALSSVIAGLGVKAAKQTVSTKPPFKFSSVNDLMAKPKSINWLIKDVFENGSLCQLFGESGSAKSFMAIDWSCCIATGTKWKGKTVNKGSVFYIAGEGQAGLSRRIEAWEKSNASLKDASLFFSNTSAALADTGNVIEIANVIEEMALFHGNPKFIVIDTLARNIGHCDENSNSDISKFINNLDIHLRQKFDASILVVHHSGHNDSGRARGASALRAALDHEYMMSKKDDTYKLKSTKEKEHEPPPVMSFVLETVKLDGYPTDEENKEVVSAVLELIFPDDTAEIQPLSKPSAIALKALKDHSATSPVEANSLDSAVKVPVKWMEEDHWEEEATKLGISNSKNPDSIHKAFTRAVKDLKLKGLVICCDGAYCFDTSSSPQK